MAEFNNAVANTIGESKLTPAETIVVLDMISIKLKQLLELKKVK